MITKTSRAGPGPGERRGGTSRSGVRTRRHRKGRGGRGRVRVILGVTEPLVARGESPGGRTEPQRPPRGSVSDVDLLSPSKSETLSK